MVEAMVVVMEKEMETVVEIVFVVGVATKVVMVEDMVVVMVEDVIAVVVVELAKFEVKEKILVEDVSLKIPNFTSFNFDPVLILFQIQIYKGKNIIKLYLSKGRRLV